MSNTSSLLFSSGQFNASLVATRTPSRAATRPGTPRRNDKFEFDAPQFEDFTQAQYHLQRRLLEEAVLPPEQRTIWNVTEVSAEVLPPLAEGEDDTSWFEERHWEHEPSSPMTPAGPLITPDGGRTPRSGRILCHPQSPLSGGMGTLRATPVAEESSPVIARSFGLRSKPRRILHSGGSRGSSSIGSSPVIFPEMMEMKTPTSRKVSPSKKRWKVSLAPSLLAMDARSSNSIEQRYMEIEGRSSFTDQSGLEQERGGVLVGFEQRRSSTSLPSVAGWSSIPETPPILASAAIFEMDAVATLRKRSLPKDSPLSIVHKRVDDETIPVRRIGLASRAMRVPAQPYEDDEVNQQTVEQSISSIVVRPKSPSIKRVRVDARFCPVPAPVKSRGNSPPKPAPKVMQLPPKKDKPVKLDELKKLLAEHNQKLRPPANVTRRR